MSQVVIYNQDNGVPAVLMPTPDALKIMTIQQIAVKDVPAGKRFGIVSISELPKGVPQEAWVVSEAQLNDGIGEKQ
jgi:hypothetical protein